MLKRLKPRVPAIAHESEIEMKNDKSCYRRGLIYYCGAIICFCLFLTTPDGESFFKKLIGSFGISQGIRLGNNGTLYIYGIVPIAAGIVCIRKALKYWQGYGSRFKDYSILLRVLPLIIIVPVVLVSTNIVPPSGIDRIYYAAISQRNGLQAITYSSADRYLEYRYSENAWSYSYNIKLENHGNDTLTFNIKLIPEGHEGFHEAFIRDENGDIIVFTLLPYQRSAFSGDTIEHLQSAYASVSGSGIFSIVLTNDYEQFSPKRIIR